MDKCIFLSENEVSTIISYLGDGLKEKKRVYVTNTVSSGDVGSFFINVSCENSQDSLEELETFLADLTKKVLRKLGFRQNGNPLVLKRNRQKRELSVKALSTAPYSDKPYALWITLNPVE